MKNAKRIRLNIPYIMIWALIVMAGCGPVNEKNKSANQGNDSITGTEESMSSGKTVTEAADLTDGQWILIKLGGEAINPEEGQKPAYLVFDEENSRFGGNNSCNDIGGNYSLKEGNRITFSQIISTQMACMPNEIELPFMEVLDKVDNYTINGDTLSLNKARMAPLAVFVLGKKE
ncbi:META domain-containing protein [Robertkochia marina]|uniref:META domain-containing protein n=1 Tax=Robertkochia marina TaxID=1227945 RepID=A0A4S3M3Z7_9FLAO|nr:META domain-containing protein [Robertkochia marina]THD69600.1 META domain-containing protein [Robertkochia marina]TRZ47145.1 META domain-containing protein [Robertkochia marina]